MVLVPLTSEEDPLQPSKKGKQVLRFLLKVGKDYLMHIHETTAVYASRGALHNLFHRLLVDNILVGEWIHGKRYYAFQFADPDVCFFLHHSFDPPRVWQGGRLVAPNTTRVKHVSGTGATLFESIHRTLPGGAGRRGDCSHDPLPHVLSRGGRSDPLLPTIEAIKCAKRTLLSAPPFMCKCNLRTRTIPQEEGRSSRSRGAHVTRGETMERQSNIPRGNAKRRGKYRQLLTNSDMQANIREFEEKTHLKRVKKTILPSVTRLEKRFVAACETCHKRLSASLSFLLNLLDQI